MNLFYQIQVGLVNLSLSARVGGAAIRPTPTSRTHDASFHKPRRIKTIRFKVLPILIGSEPTVDLAVRAEHDIDRSLSKVGVRVDVLQGVIGHVERIEPSDAISLGHIRGEQALPHAIDCNSI